MPEIIQGTMKQIFLFAALSSIAFTGILYAQEAEIEPVPEAPSAVADADNPGLGLLDQATDAKLRANTILDLGQVISLCQRAKNAGLSGENLEYCNQLLASSRLQRGLFLANSLLNPNNPRPRDAGAIRETALIDLEEAVTVIKNQPNAYIRIALLNLSPNGNEERAKEALRLAIQYAKDEPAVQVQAVRMLADLEPDTEKRAVMLADAAKEGNPQIRLDYAALLLELRRSSEAQNVLKNLIESESGNIELYDHIVALLSGFREHTLAIEVLDLLREKGTDAQKDKIDLVQAEMLAKMGQHDEALKIINPLLEKYKGLSEMGLLTLMLRAALHFSRENFDEALKDIEAVESIVPDLLPALEQKYRIFTAQENYKDALAVAKKLQAVEPDTPVHFLREVHVLSELQKHDDAVEIIQNLRKEYPDEEPLWIMALAETYSKQKEYGKALALIEKQLEKEPDAIRWIASKTKVLTDQKNWDEAVGWLESCLQKDADSEAINLLLIGVLADKKSFRAAKEQIKPLLAKKPDDLALLRMDSQISISLGLHNEAVKTLEKVVEADPGDYTSVNNLAWLLCTSPIDSVRNGRRAVELAEKAGQLSNFKRAFVLSTLAAAYAEEGDFDKAKEWSQKSIELAKTEKGQTEEDRKELLEHLQKEWDSFSREEPFREYLDEEKK